MSDLNPLNVLFGYLTDSNREWLQAQPAETQQNILRDFTMGQTTVNATDQVEDITGVGGGDKGQQANHLVQTARMMSPN